MRLWGQVEDIRGSRVLPRAVVVARIEIRSLILTWVVTRLRARLLVAHRRGMGPERLCVA